MVLTRGPTISCHVERDHLACADANPTKVSEKKVTVTQSYLSESGVLQILHSSKKTWQVGEGNSHECE